MNKEIKFKTRDYSMTVTGLWFHSFETNDNGKRECLWQGQVIQMLNDYFYMVQLYEWLMGEPTIIKVVSIHDMADWDFYTSNEEMIETAKIKRYC